MFCQKNQHFKSYGAKCSSLSLQIDPKKAERRDGKMFVGGVKGETSDEAIIVSHSNFEQFPL